MCIRLRGHLSRWRKGYGGLQIQAQKSVSVGLAERNATSLCSPLIRHVHGRLSEAILAWLALKRTTVTYATRCHCESVSKTHCRLAHLSSTTTCKTIVQVMVVLVIPSTIWLPQRSKLTCDSFGGRGVGTHNPPRRTALRPRVLATCGSVRGHTKTGYGCSIRL